MVLLTEIHGIVKMCCKSKNNNNNNNNKIIYIYIYIRIYTYIQYLTEVSTTLTFL